MTITDTLVCRSCGSRDEYPAVDPDNPAAATCTACGSFLLEPYAPAGQLAVPSAGEIEQLLTARALPIVSWAAALLEKQTYEVNEEADASLEIVAAILGGQTSAEILAATNMRTVEDLIGTAPGGHSPLLEITGAHPMKSTFSDGPSCFAVISATTVASGEQFKFTCGARAVQAAILAHIYRDLMPFQCLLVRRLKPTRAGFYPLNLEAGG